MFVYLVIHQDEVGPLVVSVFPLFAEFFVSIFCPSSRTCSSEFVIVLLLFETFFKLFKEI
jgi:hypothetical protein